MSRLVSMKMSRAEQKARYEGSAPASSEDRPSYPYGLTVNLDNDSLTKLGIDASDLEVGAELVLVASVTVANVSSNETEGGGKNQSVGLQITALCLEDDRVAAADAAKALYDGD